MVESIVTVVIEVAKCLAPPTEHQFNYFRNYKSNFKNLKEELENLKGDRDSMQHRVEDAKRQGEVIEGNVEKWLTKAKNIVIDAEKIIGDEEKANNRCFKGLCPNLKTRYQLSKAAQEQLKPIVNHRKEGIQFHTISYRTIPEDISLQSSTGYEAFESRFSTLRDIRNALTNANAGIIGVYGMGGIGKTTLVKAVARQAKERKLFDQVVFSEVSQTPNIKDIQKEIAEKLGLILHEETVSRRASRLYERLKEEKKILVVLDNLWKCLNLETVGIPYGDDHKGCKILLTSRDRSVLLKMGSAPPFLIGVLNEEEAWRLFKMTAGDDVEHRELNSTARNVAMACGGLPIALTTIARALRNRSMREWKNALQQLRAPSSVNFEGISAEAYSAIDLSIKYLRGDKLRKILLLCSLMGNRIATSDLFKYCMGWGILKGVNKMADARIKLDALVQELRDSSLLLAGDNNEELSMHDIVRDVATSTACHDQNVFVVRDENVWGWPDDEDALEKYYAISIIDSSIPELPEGLEYPKLEFLFMCSKDPFVEINISKSFFKEMRMLRVVGFSKMQLSSLPSSMDLLVNLQTLSLDQSMLGDIAIIGKLKNLEILSMINSDIVKLPEAFGLLTKLRLLDLTDCFQLKVIAPNVLSSLIRLEELYMRNCFVQWEVRGVNTERSCAGLDELMHLPRLTSLEIDIGNDDILPEGFFSRRLENFKISVGDAESVIPSEVLMADDWFRFSRPFFFIANQQTLRMLKLKLNSTTICSKKLQGIRNVEYLCLDKLQGIKNVLFELDAEIFSQLKHLRVQNNPDFLCIVDSMERVPCDSFPLLQTLTLYNLINLERICSDPLKVESFNELRTMKIENCDKLSNIFLLSATNCLPRLERISVIDCSNMEEIFAVCGEADINNNNAIEKIDFAELKSLSLGNLPKLSSFCSEVKAPSASSNRQDLQDELTGITLSNEISLEDSLDTSTPFFNEKVVLPNLEALELYQINLEKIWHNQLPAMLPGFQSLTRLIVCSCDKMKTFASELSSSGGNIDSNQLRISMQQPLFFEEKIFTNLEEVALSRKDIMLILQGNFPQHLFGRLQQLEVWHDDLAAGFPVGLLEVLCSLENLVLSCNSYEEIFSNEGCLEKHVDVRKFARIKSLRLVCLNHLIKYLLKQDSQLNSIFQYLEFLSLHYCQNLLSLLPLSSSISFGNLTHLVVHDCEKLVSLVTCSVAKSLERLVMLSISGCSAMRQVIIGCGQGDSDIAAANLKEEIVFSKLRYIGLLDLENLTSFCSGAANYTIKFPSLEDLSVTGCRNMKIFTTGDLVTPKRVNVWFSERECRWDYDLNTIIRHLHQEQNAQVVKQTPVIVTLF
ncbi:Disease resistance protein [Citrus sinensis]|uniref:Disease resistance protein n=1 Tax=Citrus sinensis TaxID=2711 RepID=A0ACB8KKU7_CITSI|nr:Disease resistance protein [Citrus sinensis]